MHPIMFRIPLPEWHVPWSWLLLAAAAVAFAVAVWWEFERRKEGGSFWTGWGPLLPAALGALAVLAVIVRKFISPSFLFQTDGWDMEPLPIYSYGVMLGLSLVVGWYLTLGLAERDGMPKDTMANCYIVTAVVAVIGSRVLYVVTNWKEFENNLGGIFAMRSGGLVAYGGFLGGFVGSLLFLRAHQLRLLPWADWAVPSLASGLMITRIGCYLFGCDFGQRLPDGAPGWLKTLGSFPHWAAGTLDRGEGAPAWSHHVNHLGLSRDAAYSFPVHPTQLYESLVGAMLLALLLVCRRYQKFRGQIFLIFTFAYGVCRFLLEFLRADEERGWLPLSLPEHVLFPGALLLLAIGYVVGFSRMIQNVTVQRITQVLAFIPPILLFVRMRPETFGTQVIGELSTSQAVAVSTGFAAAIAFSVYYKAALAHPESAMHLDLPPQPQESDDKAKEPDTNVDADADEDEEAAPASDRPVAKPKKTSAKKVAKTKSGAKTKKKASPSTAAGDDTTPQEGKGDKSKSTATDDASEDG